MVQKVHSDAEYNRQQNRGESRFSYEGPAHQRSKPADAVGSSIDSFVHLLVGGRPEEHPGCIGTTPLGALGAPQACSGRNKGYVQTSITPLRSTPDQFYRRSKRLLTCTDFRLPWP